MTDDFRERLHSRLTAFRDWYAGRDLPTCRLVQYNGDDSAAAVDVPSDEIESEITGALCEGLSADWNEHDGTLFLVIWEPESLPWTWQDVFAETARNH